MVLANMHWPPKDLKRRRSPSAVATSGGGVIESVVAMLAAIVVAVVVSCGERERKDPGCFGLVGWAES